MKQPSLFDDKEPGASLPVVGVPGRRTALSPEQKLFNKLIARIGTQRQWLQQWRDFVPQYQQRYAADVAPLQRRLREKRMAMVKLLDQAMGDKALGKSQRADTRHEAGRIHDAQPHRSDSIRPCIRTPA